MTERMDASSIHGPRRRMGALSFAIGIGIALVCGTQSASALNGNIFVIQCTNCLVASDFVDAAVSRAVGNAQPGTYVVISGVEARTANVIVTGTLKQRCPQTEPCTWTLTNAVGVAVDEDGATATTQSALEQNDMKLFGTNRKAPIKPIPIPPESGTSVINNELLDIVTGSAIGTELYVNRGINPNSVQIDTIVTVVFSDGTSAKFRRISKIASIQWKYVPGSARDKNGKKIDLNGNIVGNSNTGGTGEGTASFGGTTGGGFISRGKDRCITSSEFWFNGVLQWTYTQILPC